MFPSTMRFCILSFQLIYKHWMNTLMGYCGPFVSESGYCERLKEFISANLQWIQVQVEKNPTSPYWYQVINECLSHS